MSGPFAEYACEVAVIGGGPVGVTLANLLGRLGLDTIVFERETEIHAAPRAVGVDDLALRIWRLCGLPEDLWPDMTPLGPNAAGMVFRTRTWRLLAAWRPEGRAFRWPRGVTMVQTQVEARLRAGLAAHPMVRFLQGHEVTSVAQTEDFCTIKGKRHDGLFSATASWAVGCEGGHSLTRRAMGMPMQGSAGGVRWLIVDTVETSAGRRSARDVEVFGIARRAAVSVPRKGGHRRWEFQLAEDSPAGIPSPDRIQSMIEEHGGPPKADIRRMQIYRFASRSAERYAKGRLTLAGDSAHVMPPYAAQGLSCGLEDAANLHWRLWLMTRHGARSGRLLADYDMERRAAVRRSQQLSRLMALMVVPGGPLVEAVRDGIVGAAMTLPPMRHVLTRGDMRVFSRYRQGTFLRGGPGGRVLPHMEVSGSGALDDHLGRTFTLLINAGEDSFADTPSAVFWRALDATVLRVSIDTGQGAFVSPPPSGPWKRWLATGRVVIVRPDRVVLAHGRISDLPRLTHACARVLGLPAHAAGWHGVRRQLDGPSHLDGPESLMPPSRCCDPRTPT